MKHRCDLSGLSECADKLYLLPTLESAVIPA
jgi:hypothetical protein